MEIQVGRNPAVTVLVDEDVYEKALSERRYFCKTDRGYIVLKKYIPKGGNRYTEEYLHRYVLGASKGQYVDHIDRDKLNNLRSNLRICTGQQNVCNRPQQKGQYKGVHQARESGKWIAQITVQYKTKHLGSFDTPKEAALAYNSAAIHLHGEFAFLNAV